MTATREAVAVGRDGAFEAGVLAVALGALALSFAIGTRPPFFGALALFTLLCTPLTLVAALAGRRYRARAGRHSLRLAALLTVTLAGAIVRYHGITFALPYVPHPDEPAVVNIAQRMLVTGDLDPRRFVYPSLYIYLQALVYALHLGWGFTQGLYTAVSDLPASTDRITTAPGIYLWGRSLTAALGTSAILLVYGAGRLLYGPRVGLLAALLLAFTPDMIDDAHLITVDVPAAAFTALAFYWIAQLYRAPLTAARAYRWGSIVRAGVGVGLAAATKYNAALILLPLALVPLLRGARAPWRVWLGGGLATTLTFLLVTPYALPDLPTFLDDTAGVITHYKYLGHAGFEGDHNWWYYADYLWRGSAWTFILALGGFVLMLFRRRRADLLLLPFPLLYYSTLAGLKVNFTRNLMPLYPFLALAAAVGLLAAAGWGTRAVAWLRRRDRRVWRAPARQAALVALLVVPASLARPAAYAGYLDNLRARTDSRVVAQRWMEDHLSCGVYWLVQLPPQQWFKNHNAVTGDDFGPLPRHPVDWYPAHGFGYLLLDTGTYRPYLDDPARYPAEAAWYQEALARYPMIQRFPANPGPELVLLSTDFNGLAMQQPSEARFGGGDGDLALLGYNLGPIDQPRGLYFASTADEARRPFRPGEAIGLTLLWQPLRPPRDDLQLFVHVRDARGTIVAQRDTPLRQERDTAHGCRATDLTLGGADLPLPATLPPGRYTVVIGLYPAGQPRLPVRPARDAAPLPDSELTLATIELGR